MPEEIDFKMPLIEAMNTQRAIRRLKPDPVDDVLVLQLIELALKAPSGSNSQNWEFIVVKDREIKGKLARQNRIAWTIYGGLGRRLRRNNPKALKIIRAVQWQADHFKEIPVIVVACLKGWRLPFPHILATSYFGSIYPSIQNLLLAARAANLGATIITLPLWNVAVTRRILALPWKITPCAMIPLGWPSGRYGPTTRRPIHEVVSFDTFGHRPVQQGKWSEQGLIM
jgi:nitroreductase